jgi:membrane protein required for colicin V production
MAIDIVFFVLVFFAAIKGFQRGLIIAVFSILAFIIGLAAAIKLSAVAAVHIGKAISVTDKWLPVVSFVAVFIFVVILVRFGAKVIEKVLRLGLLGWANRMGGILFYTILYTIILSILIFYAEELHILKPITIHSSATYPYIQPLGPRLINAIGNVIPVFRDMFTQLEDFFASLSHKVQ